MIQRILCREEIGMKEIGVALASGDKEEIRPATH